MRSALHTTSTTHRRRSVTLRALTAVALGVAVRIDPTVTITETGGPPDPRTVEISWTPMDAAAYSSVTYECTGGDVVNAPDSLSCVITANPPDDPRLVVTVTVDSATYTREYRP